MLETLPATFLPSPAPSDQHEKSPHQTNQRLLSRPMSIPTSNPPYPPPQPPLPSSSAVHVNPSPLPAPAPDQAPATTPAPAQPPAQNLAAAASSNFPASSQWALIFSPQDCLSRLSSFVNTHQLNDADLERVGLLHDAIVQQDWFFILLLNLLSCYNVDVQAVGPFERQLPPNAIKMFNMLLGTHGTTLSNEVETFLSTFPRSLADLRVQLTETSFMSAVCDISNCLYQTCMNWDTMIAQCRKSETLPSPRDLIYSFGLRSFVLQRAAFRALLRCTWGSDSGSLVELAMREFLIEQQQYTSGLVSKEARLQQQTVYRNIYRQYLVQHPHLTHDARAQSNQSTPLTALTQNTAAQPTTLPSFPSMAPVMDSDRVRLSNLPPGYQGQAPTAEQMQARIQDQVRSQLQMQARNRDQSQASTPPLLPPHFQRNAALPTVQVASFQHVQQQQQHLRQSSASATSQIQTFHQQIPPPIPYQQQMPVQIPYQQQTRRAQHPSWPGAMGSSPLGFSPPVTGNVLPGSGVHQLQPGTRGSQSNPQQAQPGAGGHQSNMQHRPFFPPNNAPVSQPAVPDFRKSALHLAHLRSPILRPRSLNVTSPTKQLDHFRHVIGFALEPHRLTSDLKQDISFHLSPQIVEKLLKLEPGQNGAPPSAQFDQESITLRLRCCQVAPKAPLPTESKWALLDASWPTQAFFSINQNGLQPRHKLHYGKCLPIDLSFHAQPYNNKLTVRINRSRKDKTPFNYAIAVEIVGFETREGIKQRCMKSFVPSDQVLRGLKQSLSNDGDDDDVIMQSNLTLRLFEPFSNAKMFDIPIRGRDCLHKEAFDLDVFLDTRPRPYAPDDRVSKVDVWKCPFCNADCRPQSLVVDGFLVDVRRNLAAKGLLKTRSIVVERDGTWTPVQETQDDEDSEDEAQPTPKKKIDVITIDDD